MLTAAVLAVAALLPTTSEPPQPSAPADQHVTDWGSAIEDAFGDIGAANLACTDDGIVCYAAVNPADLRIGGCVLIGTTSSPELVDDYSSGDVWGFIAAIQPTTLSNPLFGLDDTDVDTALDACIALGG